MRIYGYLRASTKNQAAARAKSMLSEFIKSKGQAVAYWFIENESGAKLDRPELTRLLDIAVNGDVILIEQVDRLSRMKVNDWDHLKRTIEKKGLKVVALDLPTSHQFLTSTGDEFTERMLGAINSMMLDMLAAIAYKDLYDKKRRQKQGIERAKSEGKYRGRQIDKELHSKIRFLLKDGKSYSQIQSLLGCSRHTISRASKLLKLELAEGE